MSETSLYPKSEIKLGRYVEWTEAVKSYCGGWEARHFQGYIARLLPPFGFQAIYSKTVRGDLLRVDLSEPILTRQIIKIEGQERPQECLDRHDDRIETIQTTSIATNELDRPITLRWRYCPICGIHFRDVEGEY